MPIPDPRMSSETFEEGTDLLPDEHATLAALQNHIPQGKILKFETLAKCGEEVWIECNGQLYRLRRTRQGKLILTK